MDKQRFWGDRIKHIICTQYIDNKYMEKVAQREVCSLLLYKSIYNNPFMPFWIEMVNRSVVARDLEW